MLFCFFLEWGHSETNCEIFEKPVILTRIARLKMFWAVYIWGKWIETRSWINVCCNSEQTKKELFPTGNTAMVMVCVPDWVLQSIDLAGESQCCPAATVVSICGGCRGGVVRLLFGYLHEQHVTYGKTVYYWLCSFDCTGVFGSEVNR